MKQAACTIHLHCGIIHTEMRKAFTLVEMLIVVVVLVTLMTITFRLGAINETSSRRNTTVTRLQKLENCLSGYFAAFGSYPPVAQHGSYNFYLRVDDHGIQNLDGDENTSIFGWDPDAFRRGSRPTEEIEAWNQVQAACRAQPVGCAFPFRKEFSDFVTAWSDQLKEEAADSKSLTQAQKSMFAAGFDDGISQNIGRHARFKDKTDWRDVQLFKFGLMSFLLPRYLIMMASDESLYSDYAQWTGNNSMPSDPLTGQKYISWRKVWDDANRDRDTTDYARVANIPSQAVCARWMPNLEDSVYTPHSTLSIFGVDIADNESTVGFSLSSTEVHSPGGYDQSSTSGQYVLDFCTVRDGWWEEFYYYSPPPYQTYVLWSSGPDKRTFPPWISRDSLDSKANRCVSAWIEDDIVNMSH